MIIYFWLLTFFYTTYDHMHRHMNTIPLLIIIFRVRLKSYESFSVKFNSGLHGSTWTTSSDYIESHSGGDNDQNGYDDTNNDTCAATTTWFGSRGCRLWRSRSGCWKMNVFKYIDWYTLKRSNLLIVLVIISQIPAALLLGAAEDRAAAAAEVDAGGAAVEAEKL